MDDRAGSGPWYFADGVSIWAPAARLSFPNHAGLLPVLARRLPVVWMICKDALAESSTCGCTCSRESLAGWVVFVAVPLLGPWVLFDCFCW